MDGGVRDELRVLGALSPFPVQLAAIPAHVAILPPQLFSLSPRGCVVSVMESAPQLSSVPGNLCFIASNISPDVSPIPPSILGKYRSRTHPDQQQDSSNYARHMRSPFDSQNFSVRDLGPARNASPSLQTPLINPSCAGGYPFLKATERRDGSAL
jgi:hypothetical protein